MIGASHFGANETVIDGMTWEQGLPSRPCTFSSGCDCDRLDILNVEEPDETWENCRAFDDVKGGELLPQLVHDARCRELKYLAQRRVYEYSSTSLAYRRTGKRPLRLKWIDSNKGDTAHPNVRSRLVCTEVRPKGVEAIFAATPPFGVFAHAYGYTFPGGSGRYR